MRSLSWGVLMLVVACSTGRGADWPQFRGPSGQGVAEFTGVPLHWSASENIAWKTELPGLAWSSPVIVDGRVYLTNAVETSPNSFSLQALCLAARDGAILWEKPLFEHDGDVQIHKKNSHASPTPYVDQGRVFVHFGPHGTACLSTEGEVLWKTDKLKYAPQHGNGGSPALVNGTLIICCDGTDDQYVVGLDAGTGAIRWRTDRDTAPSRGFSFSTPLPIDVDGKIQVVCPASDAVFAYDPATGDEVWRVQYEGGYSVVPRPVFAQGLVFVCTGYNKPKILAIDPRGSGDITDTNIRWTLDRGAPHNPSPLVVGGELYCVSDRGIATCVDIKTGEIHWQERLGGNFSASPTYADGRVYFQDEEGTTIVVRAATEFEELARNQLTDGARTFASFGVQDGTLFVRSERALYRIDGP